MFNITKKNGRIVLSTLTKDYVCDDIHTALLIRDIFNEFEHKENMNRAEQIRLAADAIKSVDNTCRKCVICPDNQRCEICYATALYNSGWRLPSTENRELMDMYENYDFIAASKHEIERLKEECRKYRVQSESAIKERDSYKEMYNNLMKRYFDVTLELNKVN